MRLWGGKGPAWGIRLGTVLVTIAATQNLVSIMFWQFNHVKGRFASALDPVELAGFHFEFGRMYLIGEACSVSDGSQSSSLIRIPTLPS